VISGLANRGWITTGTQTLLDSASVWVDQRLVWNELQNIASSFGLMPLVSPQFWWSLGAGIVFLTVAALLLDHRSLETAPYSPIVIRLWSSSGNRAWRRLAIAGKDYRQFMGGAKGLIARFLLYPGVPLAAIWGTVHFGTANVEQDDVATTVFWFCAAFLTIEAAALASRIFRTEIAELTWSSLAVLPRWRPFVVLEKLAGACLGLVPGLIVLAIAFAGSETVQNFFFGPHRDYQMEYLRFLLLVQPVLWVSVTSLAALIMLGAPPTVTIFCGFLAIVLNWVMTLFGGMLLFGTSYQFEYFAILYLTVTLLISLVCLITTMLRLRKLTETA
jgi:hypothetical protein